MNFRLLLARKLPKDFIIQNGTVLLYENTRLLSSTIYLIGSERFVLAKLSLKENINY